MHFLRLMHTQFAKLLHFTHQSIFSRLPGLQLERLGRRERDDLVRAVHALGLAPRPHADVQGRQRGALHLRHADRRGPPRAADLL